MPRPGMVVDPLFYEALSCEFIPPCSPEGRPHTLGRIASATFSKGQLGYGDRVREAIYTPSWAPAVRTTIRLRDGVLTGLLLCDLSEQNPMPWCEFESLCIAEESTIKIAAPPDRNFTGSLNSEPGMIYAKQVALSTAVEFFNAYRLPTV